MLLKSYSHIYEKSNMFISTNAVFSNKVDIKRIMVMKYCDHSIVLRLWHERDRNIICFSKYCTLYIEK